MTSGDRQTGRRLRVLDLFAGAGGLSEGFRQAGHFDTIQAVEMDPSAAATYALNHTDASVYVGPIEEWLAENEVPLVDVVIGGPPCQGFSTLGKQEAGDRRNGLWLEYVRTVQLAQPSYFVVENVPAFLKSSEFLTLRAEFETGGMLADYAFQVSVLNAADFGAPQARRRAVLIGHKRCLPFPGWPFKASQHRTPTVHDALRPVTGNPKQNLPSRVCTFDGLDLPGPFQTFELHVRRNYSDISLQRFRCIPPGGNRFDIAEQLLAPCWKKHRSGASDVMGRLHWDKPSVTIRTEFFKPEKGRYLHPVEHRAITHLEAALLQGFPLDYKWVGTKVAIARQIGNAVPVPLGRAIGAQLAVSFAAPALDDPRASTTR